MLNFKTIFNVKTLGNLVANKKTKRVILSCGIKAPWIFFHQSKSLSSRDGSFCVIIFPKILKRTAQKMKFSIKDFSSK